MIWSFAIPLREFCLYDLHWLIVCTTNNSYFTELNIKVFFCASSAGSGEAAGLVNA